MWVLWIGISFMFNVSILFEFILTFENATYADNQIGMLLYGLRSLSAKKI